jgi:dolichol-phosphate mannosyltransferase
MTAPAWSVVIPVKDEAPSLPELVRRLLAVATTVPAAGFEIVLVDDGSSDGSWAVMRELAVDARVRGLRLRRNFGKAAALQAGIAAARGEVIVTMDADLQDEPEELPRFLQALEGPVDVVSGWKRVRHDPWHKTVPSRLFNAVTARVSGVPLHDFNCGFKAYRREVFRDINLYGELHRFVPVLAHDRGFRIAEIEVRHHPRRHGRSKYGLARLFRGAVDLLTVLTIGRYAQRPGHLFGGVGLILGSIGFLLLLYLTLLKLFTGADIGTRPLLQLGILLSIVGIQTVLFGMLAELIIARSAPPDPATLVAERTDPRP